MHTRFAMISFSIELMAARLFMSRPSSIYLAKHQVINAGWNPLYLSDFTAYPGGLISTKQPPVGPEKFTAAKGCLPSLSNPSFIYI